MNIICKKKKENSPPAVTELMSAVEKLSEIRDVGRTLIYARNSYARTTR